MKKIRMLIITLSLFIVICSCNIPRTLESSKPMDNEIWPIIETMLPEDVEISDERPHPGILSEKEVLIKAAKIAVEDGYVNTNHPLYTRDQPKLLNAYIEVPVLVYDLSVPVEDAYNVCSYFFNAVDENGESLLNVFVDPNETSGGGNQNQYGSIGITPSNASSDLSKHYITKREVEELIKSQFPGQKYEGPIAAVLDFEGNPYSKSLLIWYFTIGDSAERSVTESNEYKEYLINMIVAGYRDLPGKLTAPASRAAIDSSKSNLGFTFKSRMVQLVEPIYFFDKIKEAKEGRSTLATTTTPAPARVIPVPLK